MPHAVMPVIIMARHADTLLRHFSADSYYAAIDDDADAMLITFDGVSLAR